MMLTHPATAGPRAAIPPRSHLSTSLLFVAELVIAEIDHVARRELVRVDLRAVDVHAVRAAEARDPELSLQRDHARVLARHPRAGHDDVRARRAPDDVLRREPRHAAFAGPRDGDEVRFRIVARRRVR